MTIDTTLLAQTELDPRTPPDTERMDRLHAGLVSQAEAQGLVDVAYRVLDTPVGALLLAASDVGLVRVAFAIEDHDQVLQTLAATISPRVLAAPARLDGVARQLDEYFDGERRSFDLAVDLRRSGGFRREILERLPQVGYGQTVTYAAMAAVAGRPKAVRAVGSACATNPVPIVVPCHRIVRSDGSLGGYLGGLVVKRQLLTLESPPPQEQPTE